MATSFGSGELTLSLTQQALGADLECNFIRVRTLKGASLCSVGATGVAVGSDFPIIGGECHTLYDCNLDEVFVIGLNTTDKIFFCYSSGSPT